MVETIAGFKLKNNYKTMRTIKKAEREAIQSNFEELVTKHDFEGALKEIEKWLEKPSILWGKSICKRDLSPYNLSEPEVEKLHFFLKKSKYHRYYKNLMRIYLIAEVEYVIQSRKLYE